MKKKNKEFLIVLLVTIFFSIIALAIWLSQLCINRYIIRNLNEAIIDNDIEAIEELATTAYNLNERPYFLAMDRVNLPPLHVACRQGNLTAVQILVDHGADINSQNTWNQQTPLISCLVGGTNENRIEIACFLLDNGADPKVKDMTGCTVLDYIPRWVGSGSDKQLVIEQQQLDLAVTLINSGVIPNDNVWFQAAYANNVSLLDYLINHCDMDVNCIRPSDQYTALICAAELNAIEAVAYLLEHGADKSHVSCEGKTAYDYAIEKGFTDIVELLK